MGAWGQFTDLALHALAELGQGTYQEIADYLEVDAQPIRKALGRMANEPFGQRRVHICDYAHDSLGQRSYPRPIYKLGNGGNRKRPPPKPHTQSSREWHRRAQTALRPIHPHLSQKAAARMLAEMRRRGAMPCNS